MTPLRPRIFPLPLHLDLVAETFHLSERVPVVIRPDASDVELQLARLLVADVTDRYQIALPLLHELEYDASSPAVVLGTLANPSVRQLAGYLDLLAEKSWQCAEGYALSIDASGILVAGYDENGLRFGTQSLRQILHQPAFVPELPGVILRDAPRMPMRGLRMYLPGREDLTFFKRFLRDFASYFKYNTLILEMNAAMRLDRHPELNAGWIEFGRSMNTTRRSRPAGPGGQFQDSTHHDTGNFGVLEKDEVMDLVDYARSLGLDVIPEVPTLTHAYYLLTRHREFAEIQAAEWPDTYCPLIDEVYDLVFDVLEEILEVMTPRTVHIGHDEWRMPMHVCENCRGRDYRDMFVQDVVRVHDFLADHGVRTAMWGDHLLESVRQDGAEGRSTKTATGYEFAKPGALSPQQVQEEIPKDILILNWFWNGDTREAPEESEQMLSQWGFEQVYGNLTPAITHQDFATRSQTPGILGGAPSSWAASSEANIGKDLLNTFVGCAGLLWSETWLPEPDLTSLIQSMMPQIRRNLRGVPAASEIGVATEPVAVSTVVCESLPVAVIAVAGGALGGIVDVPSSPIPLGRDVSSIVFTHASLTPVANEMAYLTIFNFADTAPLLGWYEVEYEDRYVESVAIRYGVNILSLRSCDEGGGGLCYLGDPEPASSADGSMRQTRFEWENPRPGKIIREIRLRATDGFTDTSKRPIPANAVLLLGLAIVPHVPVPEIPPGFEDDDVYAG